MQVAFSQPRDEGPFLGLAPLPHPIRVLLDGDLEEARVATVLEFMKSVATLPSAQYVSLLTEILECLPEFSLEEAGHNENFEHLSNELVKGLASRQALRVLLDTGRGESASQFVLGWKLGGLNADSLKALLELASALTPPEVARLPGLDCYALALQPLVVEQMYARGAREWFEESYLPLSTLISEEEWSVSEVATFLSACGLAEPKIWSAYHTLNLQQYGNDRSTVFMALIAAGYSTEVAAMVGITGSPTIATDASGEVWDEVFVALANDGFAHEVFALHRSIGISSNALQHVMEAVAATGEVAALLGPADPAVDEILRRFEPRTRLLEFRALLGAECPELYQHFVSLGSKEWDEPATALAAIVRMGEFGLVWRALREGRITEVGDLPLESSGVNNELASALIAHAPRSLSGTRATPEHNTMRSILRSFSFDQEGWVRVLPELAVHHAVTFFEILPTMKRAVLERLEPTLHLASFLAKVRVSVPAFYEHYISQQLYEVSAPPDVIFNRVFSAYQGRPLPRRAELMPEEVEFLDFVHQVAGHEACREDLVVGEQEVLRAVSEAPQRSIKGGDILLRLFRSYQVGNVLKLANRFTVGPDEWLPIIECLLLRGAPAEATQLARKCPPATRERVNEVTGVEVYMARIGLQSDEIYQAFREAHLQGNEAEQGFLESMSRLIASMQSGKPQSRHEFEHPCYAATIRAIFPGHAGSFSSFEKTKLCRDRTSDLRHFVLRDEYPISVRGAVEMERRPEFRRNEKRESIIEAPLAEIHGAGRFIAPAAAKELDRRIDEAQPLAAGELSSREERLGALILEALAGNRDLGRVKELLLGHHYVVTNDIGEYVHGTHDFVRKTNAPEYYYLLELREFYGDAVCESISALMEKALATPAIGRRLVGYYPRVVEAQALARMPLLEARARLARGRIGPGFWSHLEGLSSRLSGPLLVQAQERSASIERNRVSKLFEEIIGLELPAGEIELASFDARAEIVQRTARVAHGSVREEQVVERVKKLAAAIFTDELHAIDEELKTFVPVAREGQHAERPLIGVITKNRTSAHARGVAGVCVAADNPQGGMWSLLSPRNLWDMPNYFQMVLFDPLTHRCEGALLMHEYRHDGKRVLTVSFNPTSTYLYKVDQRRLFSSLMEQVIDFAQTNGFAYVASAKDRSIRTNRTGGEFERAMNEWIARKGGTLEFKKPQLFSYTPRYSQSRLDVLWEREG